MNAINDKTKELDALASQWSNQSLLNALLRRNQLAQIEVLYSLNRVKEENLDLFYILDDKQGLVTEISLDPQTQKPFPLLGFIDNLKSMAPNLFAPSNAEPISGLYMTPRGPMLLSAKIMEMVDRPNHVLILGRYLDQKIIASLNTLASSQSTLWPTGSDSLPEKLQRKIAVIQASNNMVHIERTENSIKAYTYLSDISGTPKLVTLSTVPRNLRMMLIETMKQSYAVLLAVNFVLVLLLLKLLNYTITKPTHRIIKFLSQCTDDNDKQQTLSIQGKDEFAMLSVSVNELIEAMHRTRTKVSHQAYVDGATQGQSEVIYDVDSWLSQIIPMAEVIEQRLWSLSLDELEKIQAELKTCSHTMFDIEQLHQSIANNNGYIRDEINSMREQVRLLKEHVLRTATLVRTFSYRATSAEKRKA